MSTNTALATPPARKHYLNGLNSLRAIAALSVCLFHFTNGGLPKVIIPSIKQLFSRGYLGVEVFFVLSGFIIPYSLIGKQYHYTNFLNYFKKRLIRINPPAYISMFLLMTQGACIALLHHEDHYWTSQSAPRILHNLLFTIPFTNYSWISGIFWTLAIEFQFYLFIGLLFSFLFEHRTIYWFIGFYLLANVAQYIPGLATVHFFPYSSLFALGGVALLWQQQRIGKPIYFLLLAGFTGLAYYQHDSYVALVGLGTAVAINLLNASLPGLNFVGKISYSFYLLHLTIGTTCEFILIKFIAPTTVLNKLLITMIAILAAITGAYIFHRLVEQPFMRLASKKKVTLLPERPLATFT